jgi:hypothetical protein
LLDEDVGLERLQRDTVASSQHLVTYVFDRGHMPVRSRGARWHTFERMVDGDLVECGEMLPDAWHGDCVTQRLGVDICGGGRWARDHE